MRRLALLTALTLTGCHRLTGFDGDAGRARHGNGFHYLSLFTVWLAIFTMVVGVLFVGRALLRRSRREELAWGCTLGLLGGILFVGTAVSSLGLWFCHGTC